jgi:hypothetical protein
MHVSNGESIFETELWDGDGEVKVDGKSSAQKGILLGTTSIALLCRAGAAPNSRGLDIYSKDVKMGR